MKGTTILIGFAKPSPLTAILIFTLLLLAASVAADDMVCEHCGEKITRGGWIEFESKYFHPDHFICANCGGDLRKGGVYVEDGRKYDSACYFEMFVPKCGQCGLPIQGNYTEMDSVLYHLHCYENYIAPRCAVCGEPIYGQYLTDQRGNDVHLSHKDEYPACEYCGSLIATDGKKYSDGRHVCSLCLETAVNDIKEAKEIMAAVIENLAGYGIVIKEKKIPLELIGRVAMQIKSGSYNDDPQGYTACRKKSTLGGILSSKDFEISMLFGMPRTELVFGLAHELMHVWLFKNGKSDMDETLTEGSCQYAGMLAISEYQDEQAPIVRQRNIKNIAPVYGEGLRQVDAYVSEVGIAAWLEYLKNHTEPPW